MSGHLTIGTAGHVDHGKTALVKALTGRDTDRLAEEKRRGISIDLGFAELDLGDRRISLIDVPGHERFVRTMIAGATGIDAFLLVIAADEGPMPQTIEHLAVLRALGIEAGIVALTKCDVAVASRRLSAREAAAELTPRTQVVEVSATTGAGLVTLRAALGDIALGLGEAGVHSAPVMHIDRVFTVVGHGTVVTGTLWLGHIEQGQTVNLLPSGLKARVRSIQIHDREVDIAAARQRVALNLAGIRHDAVSRGDVVTTPEGDVAPTYRLDVHLGSGARRIAEQRRVQVHLGTREALARIANLGDGNVQLRLERRLLARRGDRVVVRSIAPPDTLGGGIVVDPAPPRHGPDWQPPRETEALAERHESLPVAERSGPGPLSRRLLAMLRDDGARPRPPSLLAEVAGVTVREAERGLAELVANGDAIRVRRDVVYPASEYRRLRSVLLCQVGRDGFATLGSARDELGISRKYAQALLEFLDSERELKRVGDRHYPRASVRP